MNKKFHISLICSAVLSLSAFAQVESVPMGVAIAETSTTIPASSYDFLTTRLNAAVTNAGLGTTQNVTQFYLTCNYTVVDKHIVPGAPTKYFQTVEMNYFVCDAFAQKVFSSVAIEAKGVGNSEEQSTTAAVRQVSPTNKNLIAFLKDANAKIRKYYDEQYPMIITKARNLAKVHEYEQALFILEVVPECCVGYAEVLQAGSEIYQKYIDDLANKALAKATAIWNAGQDAEAAAAAGEYLSEILPDATCYPQAVALSNEIKARVHSDIDYYRKREEKALDREHEAQMAVIDAWKGVGVAYGTNQRSNYYKSIL